MDTFNKQANFPYFSFFLIFVIFIEMLQCLVNLFKNCVCENVLIFVFSAFIFPIIVFYFCDLKMYWSTMAWYLK